MNVLKYILITFVILKLNICFASNYDLEIAQPQPNLDTKNRFYKAYPGLEYNVRVAINGGEFPFLYSLVEAPSGMEIDAKGVITWSNPVESQSPYNVTLTVTDASSISKTVSWTISVSQSGFRFIDAINGKTVSQGGTGSIDNPWKTIKDWYEGDDVGSIARNSYAGEFLYWREGTYLIDGFIDPDNANRFLNRDGNKPNVWLAYPGEKPIIDFNDAYINIWETTNLYIDGFEFALNGNQRGLGLVLPSSGSHVTIRRSKFHGITTGYVGGNNSHVFITRTSPGTQGGYWAIQDNEFYDVNQGYGVLGYSAEQVLIENNYLHDIDGHAIGPKEGTAMWFIRNNKFFNNPLDAIGIQYSDTGGILSGHIEVSYNLVLQGAGGGWVRVNSNQTASGHPVYVFRNTILGELVQAARPTASNGPFHFYNNVIVNDSTHADKIQQLNVEDVSKVVVTDGLTGGYSDSVVDSDGFLEPTNFGDYIGTHGHQVGARPSAPIDLIQNE